MPYGRIRIRPIQWQLRLHWSQSKEKSSKLIPLDLQSRLATLGNMWSTTCTQSAVLRAGAQLHINVLELQAIWLGLRAFSQRVENAKVALISDNTSAVAYLRNQGGTKSLAMSDLATDLFLWAEKRGMTLIPRHLPGHLNVLADHLSRRNPQDRMEHKPDRSRQDFSCLGQTVLGSVRPREKHEIGNVRLPHSGGDVMESGQSRPELGRPVRLCVPSDKPDKGLSKQGQNRTRRDHPDSARLAQSGVCPGPIRSRDRLSYNSPTSAETAHTTFIRIHGISTFTLGGYQGIPQGERIF